MLTYLAVLSFCSFNLTNYIFLYYVTNQQMHIKKYILFDHVVDIYVEIGSRISAGFKTVKGLELECGLLPALLKIYLENVLYDGNKKCNSRGLLVGSETVHHHHGTDDQGKDDAEYVTKQLIEEYQK